MPNPEPKDDFTHVPNVAYVSPMELKPNRVLIGLGVAVIVIVLGVVGYLIVDKYLLSEPVTDIPLLEIKKKTTTTNISTTSAQKNGTDSWKDINEDQLKSVNSTSVIKFSFKYPPDFRVINSSGTNVVTNNPTYPGLEAGRTSAFGTWGGQGGKNPTETTLGGKKAIKIITDKGNYINTVYSIEEESIFDSFHFVCEYAPKTGFDGDKLCDLMASTFKFLD